MKFKLSITLILIYCLFIPGIVTSGSLDINKSNLESLIQSLRNSKETTKWESKYYSMGIYRLKSLIERGEDILIIDTLPENRYDNEHIPSAQHFEFPNPLTAVWDEDKFSGKTQSDLIEFLGPDKEKMLVFYCWDSK